MAVRIFVRRATKIDGRKAIGIDRVESLALAGEDQSRSEPAPGKSAGDRPKLDGFGSGADNQPYVRRMQSSP